MKLFPVFIYWSHNMWRCLKISKDNELEHGQGNLPVCRVWHIQQIIGTQEAHNCFCQLITFKLAQEYTLHNNDYFIWRYQDPCELVLYKNVHIIIFLKIRKFNWNTSHIKVFSVYCRKNFFRKALSHLRAKNRTSFWPWI